MATIWTMQSTPVSNKPKFALQIENWKLVMNDGSIWSKLQTNKYTPNLYSPTLSKTKSTETPIWAQKKEVMQSTMPDSTKIETPATTTDFINELEYDVKNWATADEITKAYPELKNDTKLISELHYDISNGATIDEIKQAYPELWMQDINKLWLWQELVARAKNIWWDIKERFWDVKESFTREKSDNPFVSSAQSLWTWLKTAWSVIWAWFDVVWEWIWLVTPDFIKNALTWTAKKAWEITPDVVKEKTVSAIQQWWEVYNEFKKENPFLADALEWTWNIASLLPVWKWTKAIATWTKDLAKQTIKQTWKAITKWWEIATWTAEYWTKLLTWLNRETQQVIKNNPKLFQQIKKWNITPEKITNDVKTNIEKRLEKLSETWKWYNAVKSSPVTFTKQEIQWNYDNILKKEWLSKNLIELPLEDRKAVKQAQNYLDELWWDTLTSKQAVELKSKLRSLVSYDKWVSPEWQRVVKWIIKDLDTNLKNKIPWFAELDKVYWPERVFLTKVRKDLLNADWTLKDNAISTIRNLTWKWKEIKINRLEEIMPWITEKVKAIKAFEDLQNAIEWKTGWYARWVLLWWGWYALWWPVWWAITFALTHPSVASKALEIYWISKQSVKNIINKITGKKVLTKEEQTTLTNAIKDTKSNNLFNKIAQDDWISTITNTNNIGGNIKQEIKPKWNLVPLNKKIESIKNNTIEVPKVKPTQIETNIKISEWFNKSAKERFAKWDFTQTEIQKGRTKLESLYEWRKIEFNWNKWVIVSKPAFWKVKIKIWDNIKNFDTSLVIETQKKPTITEIKDYLKTTEYDWYNLKPKFTNN